MNEPEHDRDPSVASVEAALEQLGASERQSADVQFESRLLDAVRDQVLMPAPISIETARQRVWWQDWGTLAAAASVLLVAGVAVAVWSSGQSAGPTGTPTEVLVAETPAQDVEEWIETVAWLQEDLPDLAELEARAQTIGSTDDSVFEQAEETMSEGSI